MAFTPRTQEEYATALLAYAASDADVQANMAPTDLQVGSLERAEVEALALLLEENDQRIAFAIVQAISESCFNAFGFSLLPAQYAVGAIQVATNIAKVADIVIPTGWRVMGSNGLTYQTTAPGVITAGDLLSGLIPVICNTTGVLGNAPAYTITIPVSPIQGVDSVVNPSACIGGADIESEDARAIRFTAFIKTLPRGTADALEFAALSANVSVIAAKAVEPFLLDPLPVVPEYPDGIPFAGLVWLYYDDGTGTPLPVPPTGDPIYVAIKNLVEGYTDGTGNQVPGYKAAGVKVDIFKVAYVKICIRGDIRLTPDGAGRWTEIQANLLAAAQIYFSQLRIGDSVSYQNLVTVLTDCDIDILQVNLYQWLDGGSIPAYGAAMSGEPIAMDTSTGLRGVLKQETGLGPGAITVTYPEWRIIV
jgi:hypothetical protein